MKPTVCIYSSDLTYAKKLTNTAIKNLGKKYVFLAFSTLKSAKTFMSDNNIEAFVYATQDKSFMFAEFLGIKKQFKAKKFIVLNVVEKDTVVKDSVTFVYMLQQVNTVLNAIDKVLDSGLDKDSSKGAKLITFFSSPIARKVKGSIVDLVPKYVPKGKKALIVMLDEFSNYKGSVGISNLIFYYKENTLDRNKVKAEIKTAGDQDYMLSVTYAEDFDVMTNVELMNLINEIRKLLHPYYDYIIVDSCISFNKTKYVMSESDEVVLVIGNDAYSDSVKRYFKENDVTSNMKVVNMADIKSNSNVKSLTAEIIKDIGG